MYEQSLQHVLVTADVRAAKPAGLVEMRAWSLEVQRLQIVHGRAAVIALIRHNILDHLDCAIVHSHGFELLSSLRQGLLVVVVSPSSALHRYPDHRARSRDRSRAPPCRPGASAHLSSW